MRRKGIVYPESDGEPIAEHTLQFEWIVTIEQGVEALFDEDPDVFVAGTLLWYPVEGDPTIRTGPDVMVAFGRPKGHRRSYKQWEEGGIAPQVVFEILPPTFFVNGLIQKSQFYDRYGVEEFYLYNPDAGYLEGWLRAGDHLAEIPRMAGFVSPRLGVRFKLGKAPNRLKIIRPDGEPFYPYRDLYRLTQIERLHAAAARHRTDAERHRADAKRHRDEEFRCLADDFERLNEDYERRAPEDSQRIEELRRRYRELCFRLEELRR
jgi:Uma2 family endonuclease